MSPEALNSALTLYCGDCLAALDQLAENSADSCATDPPYHLLSTVKRFAKTGGGDRMHSANHQYGRLSRGFMGKVWDGGDIAFRPDTWAKVWRALKPGAHLVAFAAPKCQHRMICAIEDAGFEIRDSLLWLFGTGFPKSLDVAKAIDKRRIEDAAPTRAVCRFIRAAMDARGLVSRDLIEFFGGCDPRLIDHWAARDTDSQPALPNPAQWATLKAALALPDDMDSEVARLNARKGEPSDEWNNAPIIGEHDGETAGFGDHRFAVRDSFIREASPDAARWQGWGTALKPAYELICLARKPLSERTVAANVLRWGTGALNIDACRIGERERSRTTDPKQTSLTSGAIDSPGGKLLPDGRWPANVAHDGSAEVVALFPETASGGAPTEGNANGLVYEGGYAERSLTNHGANEGTAARFFYSAKADGDDRLGSRHPTVKPVDLMRWLCRLITPPGGLILDPFAGTGATGEAAFYEGFRAILIEREAEYQADIRRRAALLLAGPDERAHASIKARGAVAPPGPLFAGAGT